VYFLLTSNCALRTSNLDLGPSLRLQSRRSSEPCYSVPAFVSGRTRLSQPPALAAWARSIAYAMYGSIALLRSKPYPYSSRTIRSSEIFYYAFDGRLMAMPIKKGTGVEAGTPVPLFNARMLNGPRTAVGFRGQYVTPDEQRSDLRASRRDGVISDHGGTQLDGGAEEVGSSKFEVRSSK
jgi:hypothetical protein